MDDLPEPLRTAFEAFRKNAAEAATERLKHDAFDLCQHAQITAGLGVSFCFAGEAPRKDPKEPTSVVVVLSGELPRDLVDGLLEHVRGLLQDYQSGLSKDRFTVIENTVKPKPSSDE